MIPLRKQTQPEFSMHVSAAQNSHRLFAASAGIAAAMVIIAVFTYIVLELRSNILTQEQDLARTELQDLRRGLYVTLGKQEMVCNVLENMLTEKLKTSGDVFMRDIQPVLETLESYQTSFIRVTLAPDGIIREIYPDDADSDIIGLDISRIDTLLPSPYAFREDAADVIIFGPVEYYENTPLLINRFPLVEEIDNRPSVWGYVSLSFDFEEVLQLSGVSALLDQYEIGIRSRGTAGREVYHWGSRAVFTEDAIQANIAHSFVNWEIGIILKDGWTLWSPLLTVHVIMGALLAAAASLYAYRRTLRTHIMKSESTLDQLTGVLNKAEFIRQLQEEIRRMKESETCFSLAVVDIDNFKQLNDACGHLQGDIALAELARTIRDNIREDDLVGRFGGDEFVILLKNLGTKSRALAVVRKIFERISAVRLPFDYQDKVLHISMGAAFSPEDARKAEELFTIADEQLYLAKKSGKGRFCSR